MQVISPKLFKNWFLELPEESMYKFDDCAHPLKCMAGVLAKILVVCSFKSFLLKAVDSFVVSERESFALVEVTSFDQFFFQGQPLGN